jgi:hypothetical protein
VPTDFQYRTDQETRVLIFVLSHALVLTQQKPGPSPRNRAFLELQIPILRSILLLPYTTASCSNSSSVFEGTLIIDHVSTGGALCRGTRLQHVAMRVSEWERYFDVGHMRDDRRLCEPKGNSTLLWVNRGYGRKHPARNQEIAKLARRQYLE